MRRWSWWLLVGATYVVYFQMWAQTALDRWDTAASEGTFPPEWFQEQYEGSLLEYVPGLAATWIVFAVLETASAAAWIVSAARMEFMPDRERPWMAISCGLSALTFAALDFGESLTSEFQTTFELFLYFGVALLTPQGVEWADRWTQRAQPQLP